MTKYWYISYPKHLNYPNLPIKTIHHNNMYIINIINLTVKSVVLALDTRVGSNVGVRDEVVQDLGPAVVVG